MRCFRVSACGCARVPSPDEKALGVGLDELLAPSGAQNRTKPPAVEASQKNKRALPHAPSLLLTSTERKENGFPSDSFGHIHADVGPRE